MRAGRLELGSLLVLQVCDGLAVGPTFPCEDNSRWVSDAGELLTGSGCCKNIIVHIFPHFTILFTYDSGLLIISHLLLNMLGEMIFSAPTIYLLCVSWDKAEIAL